MSGCQEYGCEHYGLASTNPCKGQIPASGATLTDRQVALALKHLAKSVANILNQASVYNGTAADEFQKAWDIVGQVSDNA